MSSDSQSQRFIPPSRRRDKPILSCTLCRRRKLKCDRRQPCKACVDRGLSLSCTYARSPLAPATAEAKASHNVHDRINQLERLVTALMDAKQIGNPHSPTPFAATAPSYRANESNETAGADDADIPGTPARMKMESDETSYTSSGHWTSILDGIAELKEHLDDIPTKSQAQNLAEIPGPDLLFGRQRHATKQEILASLPPRSEADQLVVRYYAFMDMAPMLLHRPTFLREYDQFWENPAQTPIMWIGLLYGVFSIACRFQSILEEQNYPVPDPTEITFSSAKMDVYREKVVQCLILANYAKCPPYTIETFLSYFVLEYLRSRDTQFGTWIIVGMLVRTAFRMGYHREPSRFPNVSPFKAEMRRRIWAMIVQLDLMSSVQIGLPRMIQPSMHDVKEPRNLTDDDLDEKMTELPPSRPDTESTAMLYTVIRNRVLLIFARIMDLTNATEQPPYREVLEVDSALRSLYDSIPISLKGARAKDIDLASGDGVPSTDGMRKLYLGLTFLKAQLMLHRPYLLLGRTDPRYEYSRSACIDAALEILEFQRLLDAESRPGGKLWAIQWRLWTVSWRLSSLVNHDFLLATTVLTLDLDRDLAAPLPVSEPSITNRVRFTTGQPTRAEIVEALTGAYSIWISASEKSREAAKVAAAVKLVLGKASAPVETPQVTAPSPTQPDPLAYFSQLPASNRTGDVIASPSFFGLGDDANLNTPFPMGDMPMDFGGSFNWGGLESDYQMPIFEQNLQSSYFG